MVNRRKSLVDSWICWWIQGLGRRRPISRPSPRTKAKSIPKSDREGYMPSPALDLLLGDHAQRCGNLVIMRLVALPIANQSSEPYKLNSCSHIWLDCWQKYSDSLDTHF